MLILYRFSLLYTFHFIDCYYSNMYGLWNSVNRWTWVQPHTDIYLKKELSSCIFLHLQKDVTLLTSHGSHCLNSDLQTEPLLSHFNGNDGSDLSRWRYRLFLSLWLHPEKKQKQTHVDAYMAGTQWFICIYTETCSCLVSFTADRYHISCCCRSAAEAEKTWKLCLNRHAAAFTQYKWFMDCI